jgi:hypothetical protein
MLWGRAASACSAGEGWQRPQMAQLPTSQGALAIQHNQLALAADGSDKATVTNMMRVPPLMTRQQARPLRSATALPLACRSEAGGYRWAPGTGWRPWRFLTWDLPWDHNTALAARPPFRSHNSGSRSSGPRARGLAARLLSFSPSCGELDASASPTAYPNTASERVLASCSYCSGPFELNDSRCLPQGPRAQGGGGCRRQQDTWGLPGLTSCTALPGTTYCAAGCYNWRQPGLPARPSRPAAGEAVLVLLFGWTVSDCAEATRSPLSAQRAGFLGAAGGKGGWRSERTGDRHSMQRGQNIAVPHDGSTGSLGLHGCHQSPAWFRSLACPPAPGDPRRWQQSVDGQVRRPLAEKALLTKRRCSLAE